MLITLRRDLPLAAALICLLSFLTACSDRKIPAANAQPQAAQPITNSTKLWLNGDQFGTTDDPSALAAKLKEALANREKNAPAKTNGPTANANSVGSPSADVIYLSVDDNVSLAAVYWAYFSFELAPIYLIDKTPESGVPVANLDPNALVVTIGEKPLDPSGKTFALTGIEFSFMKNAGSIQYARHGGGIEILSDGTFALDPRYENFEETGPYTEYATKQQPIAEKDLGAEMAREIPGLNQTALIDVMASGKAPVRSVHTVQQTMGNIKRMLHVVVFADPPMGP